MRLGTGGAWATIGWPINKGDALIPTQFVYSVMKSILKWPDCDVRDADIEAIDGRSNPGEIHVFNVVGDTCSLD